MFCNHVRIRSLPSEIWILKDRKCRKFLGYGALCSALGPKAELHKAVHITLKDRYNKDDFIDREHWVILRDSTEKEVIAFEIFVDALFTIVDLDESNGIDADEFRFLIEIIAECIESPSVYK